MNARKQAFTWIHRNSLSQKIQENSCEHRKTRCFPKVHRMVNTGKTSVFLNSPAFAVRENTRKVLKTQEYTIISLRLPNSERWKIFLNSLEFTFLGKYKKTGENFCEHGNAPCFPYVNRAVNSGKQWVFRNLTAFAVLENKGKFRFLIVNRRWTWSFTPGKHLWTQANKTFAKC